MTAADIKEFIKFLPIILLSVALVYATVYGTCRIFTNQKYCKKLLCEMELMESEHKLSEHTMFCD